MFLLQSLKNLPSLFQDLLTFPLQTEWGFWPELSGESSMPEFSGSEGKISEETITPSTSFGAPGGVIQSTERYQDECLKSELTELISQYTFHSSAKIAEAIASHYTLKKKTINGRKAS